MKLQTPPRLGAKTPPTAGTAALPKPTQKRSKASPTYLQFLKGQTHPKNQFTFVSLFSGAGVGDYGLVLAGGECLGACEVDPHRQAVHQANIGSAMWGDLRSCSKDIVEEFKDADLDLLIATPPCQGFSSANSRRGMRDDHMHTDRDERNSLFFEALAVARRVQPKVVVFENVPSFFERKIRSHSNPSVVGRVLDFMHSAMPGYINWTGVICFSELGVPQRRKRALAVYLRRDVAVEFGLASDSVELRPAGWPGKVRHAPMTLADALNAIPSRKTRTLGTVTDPLQLAPMYSDLHLNWISSIPSGSGKSAWQNACESCGCSATPFGVVTCEGCGSTMFNRPHVVSSGGSIRPIKGFKTSYKRMAPDQLAPTITTASGHFSSDIKLHPFENRVLTPRECARLQSIPDSFVWPTAQKFKSAYLVREMIGEAVPTLVTYRLGLAAAAWVCRLQA